MKKRILSLLLAFIMVMTISSGSVLAAGKTIRGSYWQGPLQFYKDGQSAQLGANPIIIDGVTYLPVRAMATLLGVNVSWNASNRSISITGGASNNQVQANTAYYTQLVSSQQLQLKTLNDKVAQLEKEKKELETKLEEANKNLDRYTRNNSRYPDRDSRSSSYFYDLEDNLNNYQRYTRVDGKEIDILYRVDSSSRTRSLIVKLEIKNRDRVDLRHNESFYSFLERSVFSEINRVVRMGTTYNDRYAEFDSIEYDVLDLDRNESFTLYTDYKGNIDRR